MKNLKLLLLIICGTLLTPGFYANLASAAEEPTGEEIMRQAEEKQGGWEDEVALITFLMTKGEKGSLINIISRKRKNYQGKSNPSPKTLFFFKYPARYVGTIYLKWNNLEAGGLDDHWIYAKPLRKLRRLNVDPEIRFLHKYILHGIDFTYADLSVRLVTQDTHRFLRRETYNYKDCYVVESLPRDERYPYSKRVIWIWKDRELPIKVEHYDREAKLHKTLFHHYWTEVQGVWFPRHSLLKDHERKHMTILFVNTVQYNTGLHDTIFVPASLGNMR